MHTRSKFCKGLHCLMIIVKNQTTFAISFLFLFPNVQSKCTIRKGQKSYSMKVTVEICESLLSGFSHISTFRLFVTVINNYICVFLWGKPMLSSKILDMLKLNIKLTIEFLKTLFKLLPRKKLLQLPKTTKFTKIDKFGKHET